MSIDLLQKIMLLMMSFLSLLLLTLVISTYILEKKQGLNISYRRLLMACLSFLAIVFVLWLYFHFEKSRLTEQATNTPTQPLAPQPLAPQPRIDLKIRRQIAALESKKEIFRLKIDSLSQKIDTLKGTVTLTTPPKNIVQDTPRVTNQHPTINKPDRGIWLLLAGMLIFLFQIFTLLLIDNPRTLLLRIKRWFRSKKTAEQEKIYQENIQWLDQIAKSAQIKEYHEGAKVGEKINPVHFDELEQIDFYYLHNFCYLQILLNHYTTKASEFPSLSDKNSLTIVEKNLDALLGLAPNLSEGEYLYGILKMLQDDPVKAIEHFDKAVANGLSEKEAGFKNFVSTCCLQLAAKQLAEGKSAEADALFNRVISIGVAADRVPSILVENRLLHVRQQYNNRDYQEARVALNAVKQVTGLSEEQTRSIAVLTEAVEILILDAELKYEGAQVACHDFLKKWTPADLPKVDEHAADEFLFLNIQEDKLPFPAELFRGFYFFDAILQLQIAKSINTSYFDNIAQSLLRALQFSPRNREVLAALGILFFYAHPEKRLKAIDWLEAAILMGVTHPLVIEIVEGEKSKEENRSGLLERFLSLSTERLFSRDISPQMRKALLDEWGRFKDFQPVLQELETKLPIESSTGITLQAVLNRAKYIQNFAAEVEQKDLVASSIFFKQLQIKYGQLANSFQHQLQDLNELEKQVLQEIGRQVLR